MIVLLLLRTIHFDIFNCLLLAGVVQGFLLSFLLLKRAQQKQAAALFLAFTLFIFALYNLLVVSADVDLFRRVFWLAYLPLNLILGFGPCIYFYVFYALYPNATFSKKQLIHFIPVALQAAYYVSALLIPGLMEYRRQSSPIWLAVSLLEQWGALFSVVGYTVAALRLLRNFEHEKVAPTSQVNIGFLIWLKKLLFVFGCLWLVWLGYTVVDLVYFDFRLSLRHYYPIYLLVAGLTYWIGLSGYLRPPVITATTLPENTLPEELPQPAPKASNYLQEEEIEHYLRRLQQIMNEQQPYLELEFDLKTLAAHTKIKANVISFLLNNRLGTNFSDWVNTYRVEEVKKRLLDARYAHLSINGIALDCGFNSKATFNRVFKNKTGMSPKEYIAAKKTALNT